MKGQPVQSNFPSLIPKNIANFILAKVSQEFLVLTEPKSYPKISQKFIKKKTRRFLLSERRPVF
jgi:hypothetical protein